MLKDGKKINIGGRLIAAPTILLISYCLGGKNAKER